MGSSSFITGLDSLYRNDSDETTSSDSSRDVPGRKRASSEKGRGTASRDTNHENRPAAHVREPCTDKRLTPH